MNKEAPIGTETQNFVDEYTVTKIDPYTADERVDPNADTKWMVWLIHKRSNAVTAFRISKDLVPAEVREHPGLYDVTIVSERQPDKFIHTKTITFTLRKK